MFVVLLEGKIIYGYSICRRLYVQGDAQRKIVPFDILRCDHLGKAIHILVEAF